MGAVSTAPRLWNMENIVNRQKYEALAYTGRDFVPLGSMDHDTERLTYRITQFLTGHECFENYLFGIGANSSTKCAECGAECDSAQHTFTECPAFAALCRFRTSSGMISTLTSSLVHYLAVTVKGALSQTSVRKFWENNEKRRETSDPARQERRRRR